MVVLLLLLLFTVCTEYFFCLYVYNLALQLQFGASALICAVSAGHIETSKLLLKKGADFEKMDTVGGIIMAILCVY